MFTWTEDSIRQYINATEYFAFHEKLAALIRPHLKNTWTLCDIGCGLGYLDTELASSVKKITAVDLNAEVLEILRKRSLAGNIKNIEILNTDYTKLPKNHQYDCLLFSFFVKIAYTFEEIKQLAKEQIIAIVPGEGGFPIRKGTHHQKERTTDVKKFLSENGIPFTLHEATIEFGQPFTSKEDAVRFIRHYAGMALAQGNDVHDEESIMSRIERLPAGTAEANPQKSDTRYQYYLKNPKKVGIFIIQLPSF